MTAKSKRHSSPALPAEEDGELHDPLRAPDCAWQSRSTTFALTIADMSSPVNTPVLTPWNFDGSMLERKGLRKVIVLPHQGKLESTHTNQLCRTEKRPAARCY
ncbi:hypothetical protein ACP70R_019776 [Stipagrostis hirtigluma subsp. patula]